MALKLPATLLLAQILASATAEQQQQPTNLEDLNRRAEYLLANYQLDEAEPVLDQALALAQSLHNPAAEFAAQVRLADLYSDLQKRDGHYWRNLAIPHLRRALDLSSGVPNADSNPAAIKLILATLQLLGNNNAAELSPAVGKRIEIWISEVEAKDGPLSLRTALPYLALSYAAGGSEVRLRALRACDLLLELDHTPAPEFSPLLIACAQHEFGGPLQVPGFSDTSPTRRLARLARASALAGGPRYAYEAVLSYLIEVDAEFVNQNTSDDSAKLMDAARRVAAQSLAPSHPVFDRLLPLQPPGSAQHELIPRASTQAGTRIQPGAIISLVDIVYTPKARSKKFEGVTSAAVLITPDGKGTVINVFRGLPYDLSPNVDKAIGESKFRPWTKDGKPVSGVSVFEIPLHLASQRKVKP